MARDPLELRKHVPTVPDDPLDPPRFGQLVETTKDALVLELRTFLSGPGAQNLPGRLAEIPTVAKYDVGFGTGLDPYETFVKIVEDFPDVTSRLPHIAVTAADGQNRRQTAGRPFIAHTQRPPRVVTTNPGPYALAAAGPQVSRVQVLTLPGGGGDTYFVYVNSVPFAFTAPPGTNATTIIGNLAALVKAATDLIFLTTATIGAGATLTITGRTPGEAFSVEVSPNLSLSTVPAGTANADMLVYQTQPIGQPKPIQSVCTFAAQRFPTANPVSAALPDDVARVFNEQGLYAQARVVQVGPGLGVQFECGGPFGGVTPNFFEVMPGTSPGLLAAFGLGDQGTSGVGDSISGEAPAMVLNIAGAPFTPAMVGRYVTLGGTGGGDGHYLVTSGATGALGFTNPAGVPMALPVGSTWFVGFRDDSRNPLRPVQNRYHQAAQFSVSIDVWAESPNERREVLDLVFAYFTFLQELKHFTIYGRGIFDENFPQEHYQISTHQEVSEGGDQDFPRGEDQKNRIYASRVTLPVTINHYLDRQVTVLTGPRAGQTWQLLPGDVQQDDSLPRPN